MFEDISVEETIDFLDHNQTAVSSNPQTHTCEIKTISYDGRGGVYCVLFDGQVLVAKSYDPEFEACRVLLERGITGKLTTYRKDTPCMVLDIEKAARCRTTTNEKGTPVIKKQTGAESTLEPRIRTLSKTPEIVR